MVKLGVIITFILVLSSFSVLAQTDDSSQIEKAYSCLENKLSEKNDSLALEEAVFGILALGSDNELEQTLEDKEKENCWPDPTCRLKETSQVLLAYERLNKNTDDIQDYLLSKNSSATEIDWFLMIDIEQQVPATCSIEYNGIGNTVNIDEDMKLSGNPGSCLSILPNGYWMQVSNNCLDERFAISCDGFSGGNFITTLLYQKADSNDVIYVSPNTHSAPPSGTTYEEIKAKCFKLGSSCDYEGSLWATLALKEAGVEISPFLPYLFALSEDNRRFFPSSFLHIMSGSQEQYSEVVDYQTQSGFWQIPNTINNKFYDTALAMLALQGSTGSETQAAKDYLLQVQGEDGCWNNNNLRDTGFLLYAGWPTDYSTSGGGTGDGNDTDDGTGGGSLSCQSSGNYCGSFFDCTDSGGSVLSQYDCPVYADVCCSEPIGSLSTCAELGGNVCSSSQTCSGRSSESADGTCCLAECRTSSSQQLTECEQNSGLCVSSCTQDEELASFSCQSSSQVCCVPKTDGSSGGSSSSNLWIWVIVFIVLIILVVLGIIYRHKIQLWLFKKKKKGGISSSPTTPRRPPFMPPVLHRSPGRPIPRRPPQTTAQRKPTSKADKEMEETLKKLREISK